MMKNYMTMGTFVRGKKHESDSTGRAATPFHEERADMLIYGGSPSPPPPHIESWSKLKLTARAINVVGPTVLEYLCWSESSITFD
jgi:hypothetical protein